MRTKAAVEHYKATFPHIAIEEIEFLGEVTLQLPKDSVYEALSFFKQTPLPGYEVLMDLTGVDYLEPIQGTKVVYWLHNPQSYERLRITTFVERNDELASVTKLWEGADWYERELWDLFGVKILGHGDLKRILMPDDWKGHPLRKDYALVEESVEFKHGVRPKVPSEIIPYVKDKNLK